MAGNTCNLIFCFLFVMDFFTLLQVRNFKTIEVSSSEFVTPSAFIFLYEMQLFLTFRNRSVSVWNFRGELVTSFEDHLLWHPDCNTNSIYITINQDLIISYCKADPNDPSSRDNGNIQTFLWFNMYNWCVYRQWSYSLLVMIVDHSCQCSYPLSIIILLLAMCSWHYQFSLRWEGFLSSFWF